MKKHTLDQSWLKLRSLDSLLTKYYDSSHSTPLLTPIVSARTPTVFFGGLLNNLNDPKTSKAQISLKSKSQRVLSTSKPPLPKSLQGSATEPVFSELLLGPGKSKSPRIRLVRRKPMRSLHPFQPQLSDFRLETASSRVSAWKPPTCHTGTSPIKSPASQILEKLVRSQASRRYLHSRSVKEIAKRTAEITLPVVQTLS